jgi:peptidoglycan hydrolase-like protein with peptidoglycan-binding domain
VYDEPSASALVRSLLAAPPDVAVEDLGVGAESDGVARLQAALQRLGYMDVVSGYYGAITADAVASFQRDNAIQQTGAYGAITRMALATRARPLPAHADVVETLVEAPVPIPPDRTFALLP